MRKASKWLLGKWTQSPSPSPDPYPAGQNQPRTYIGIGTLNGGTSHARINKRSSIAVYNSEEDN
jgi:hypothetical protein